MTIQLQKIAQEIYTQTKANIKDIENVKKETNILTISHLITATLQTVNLYKLENRTLTVAEKETVIIDATRLLLVDLFGADSPYVQTFDEVGTSLVSMSFTVGSYLIEKAEVLIEDIEQKCSCFGKKKVTKN